MWGKRIVSIMLVCLITLSITLSANIARAGDCLVAPGSTTSGHHWYYFTDRATQKKCWHLGDASQASNEAASQTLQTLITASSESTMAAAKNGMSEEDVQTLYAQFLEWKRRTGHGGGAQSTR
jgi:hypothetical protein